MRYVDFDEEMMTEEEIDELYRPMKSNSLKSLAPLYAYLILKADSDGDNRMTQKDLRDLLEERYELSIDRKTTGRVVHALEDAGVGICYAPNGGIWFDAEADEAV